MIPHRLAFKLIDGGYTFRDDVIWYKKNSVSSNSKYNLAQAYEIVLFLSKNERSFTNMNSIRVRANEARDGRSKVPSPDMMHLNRWCKTRKRLQGSDKLSTTQSTILHLKNFLQQASRQSIHS